jgi:hypothetical protein
MTEKLHVAFSNKFAAQYNGLLGAWTEGRRKIPTRASGEVSASREIELFWRLRDAKGGWVWSEVFDAVGSTDLVEAVNAITCSPAIAIAR